MATKDLSRSVIEGGRHRHNSFERRHSHTVERARARARAGTLRLDPETAMETVEPRRPRVRRQFHDKLAPAYRFLDSRVGKSWNKTRALMAERFDTRTTAGRHILFDHLLRDVVTSPHDTERPWAEYFVDRHGVLRRTPRSPRHGVVREAPPVGWLRNRALGRRGSVLYWFVPTRDADQVEACWNGERIVHVVRGGTALQVSFRQGRALDPAERAYFDSLSPAVQALVLQTAPLRAE